MDKSRAIWTTNIFSLVGIFAVVEILVIEEAEYRVFWAYIIEAVESKF